MASPPTADRPAGVEPPRDEPRFAWFDGILEAPRGDDGALRAAETELARAGPVRVALEIDGGRFSVLVDDAAVPGERVVAARDALLDALQHLVSAAGPQGDVESTLRLTEVHSDRTREILLAVVGRELRPVWRDRATTPADLARAPVRGPVLPESAVGRRQVVLAFAAFLLLSGLLMWRSGWVDRALAPDVREIALAPGAFEGLLALDVERRFGRYAVRVVRGAEFPADGAAVQALLDATANLERRAAIDRVANGAEVFVRLERVDGRVLEAVAVRTAPLLGDAQAAGPAVLDGRISGARLVLALDDGRRAREGR